MNTILRIILGLYLGQTLISFVTRGTLDIFYTTLDVYIEGVT